MMGLRYNIAAFRGQMKIGGGGGVFVRFADAVDKIDGEY